MASSWARLVLHVLPATMVALAIAWLGDAERLQSRPPGAAAPQPFVAMRRKSAA